MDERAANDLRARLADPATRPAALDDFGRWMVQTAMLFGCNAGLAWKLAAIMVEGVERSWSDGAAR